MELKEKISVITGASSGIGRKTAEVFARYGASLILVGKNEKGLVEICSEIKNNCWYSVCDISNPKSVSELILKIQEKEKRVDILVNNAGVTRDTLLIRMKEEDWDTVMNVNLKGTFLLTKEIVKIMIKQRSGVIVNIASVVGITGNPGQTNYAASKSGIIAFTKSLAKEVGSRNVRVIAVAPGFIQTRMTENLPEEIKAKYLQSIPLQRFGKPEDVAELIAFLCSDKAKYITGTCITIDGGLT